VLTGHGSFSSRQKESNFNVSLQDAIWNLKIAVLKFRYFAIRYESAYCKEMQVLCCLELNFYLNFAQSLRSHR
jgi:hypothetical protein